MLLRKLKTANVLLRPERLFYNPSWLVLGVNNICNLHCKMCDVGVSFDRSNFFQNLMGSRPLNMPPELIGDIFEQAARFFPRVKIGYAFTEPLIYPHLFESLALARRLGLHTAVTTNALNLRRYADQLLEAGLNELFISLDGPPDVHNFIRGHKSSFERAMEGMEYLAGRPGSPKISVFCVITEWNIGRLGEFLGLFRHLPLGQIGFMQTNYTPQEVADRHNLLWGNSYPATASNMAEIDLNSMDLDKLWAEMSEIKSKNWPWPIHFSPEIRDRTGLDIFYHHPEILMGKRCNDVFSNMMIKSNGDVIPAHGRCFNLPVGNLYGQNLQEIWNSGSYGNFRRDLVNAGGLFPACARCCSAFG